MDVKATKFLFYLRLRSLDGDALTSLFKTGKEMHDPHHVAANCCSALLSMEDEADKAVTRASNATSTEWTATEEAERLNLHFRRSISQITNRLAGITGIQGLSNMGLDELESIQTTLQDWALPQMEDTLNGTTSVITTLLETKDCLEELTASSPGAICNACGCVLLANTHESIKRSFARFCLCNLSEQMREEIEATNPDVQHPL